MSMSSNSKFLYLSWMILIHTNAYLCVNFELLDLASSIKLATASSSKALLAELRTASKSNSGSSWV